MSDDPHPGSDSELEKLSAAIAASHENQFDDHERGIVVPKPELATLRMKRGTRLLELQRWAEALRDLDFVVLQWPSDPSALANRGIAHKNLGDYDKALADYTRAIEAQPDAPNAYQNRGNLYRLLERWADAEADYAKAFTIAPGYTGARQNWVEVRRLQGKPDA